MADNLNNDILSICVNGDTWDMTDKYARAQLVYKVTAPEVPGTVGQVLALNEDGTTMWKTLTVGEGADYHAGIGINISDNIISADLIAGDGIKIEGNTITCTVMTNDEGSLVYTQGEGISINGTEISVDTRTVATTKQTEEISNNLATVQKELSELNYTKLQNKPMFTDAAGNLFTYMPAGGLQITNSDDPLYNGIYEPSAIYTGTAITSTVWTLMSDETRVLCYNGLYTRWELRQVSFKSDGTPDFEKIILPFYGATIISTTDSPADLNKWNIYKDITAPDLTIPISIQIARGTYADPPHDQWILNSHVYTYNDLQNKPEFLTADDNTLQIDRTPPGIITIMTYNGSALSNSPTNGKYYLEDVMAEGTTRVWQLTKTLDDGEITTRRTLAYNRTNRQWEITGTELGVSTNLLYTNPETDLFRGIFTPTVDELPARLEITKTSTWMQDTYTFKAMGGSVSLTAGFGIEIVDNEIRSNFKQGRGISIAADGTISCTLNLPENPDNPDDTESVTIYYGKVDLDTVQDKNLTNLALLEPGTVTDLLNEGHIQAVSTTTGIAHQSIYPLNEGEFVVVLVPEGWTASKFDGSSGQVEFQETNGGVNGDAIGTLGTNTAYYYTYGEQILGQNEEVFIYVNKRTN